MILGPDSPLKRLPPGLPVKTIQLLDGIRYGIAMADLSYTRLVATLATVFGDEERRPSPHDLATAAFLDAGSLIDAVNRLRRLLPDAYRPEATSAIETFLTETKPALDLPNSLHHAEERIGRAEPVNAFGGTPPIWGTIECQAPGESPDRPRQMSLTPGTRTFRWAQSAINGCSNPRAPVDHIAIFAFDTELSLTETHASVERLARELERIAPRVRSGPGFVDLLMTSG